MLHFWTRLFLSVLSQYPIICWRTLSTWNLRRNEGLHNTDRQFSCSFTLRCQLRHSWLFMPSRSSLSEEHLVGHVTYQVLTGATFWDIVSCNIVVDRRFRDYNEITRHCIPKGCHLHLVGHVCLSVSFILGGRQPSWLCSLLWNNGTEVTIVTHCC
jgi:hypothetical protein